MYSCNAGITGEVAFHVSLRRAAFEAKLAGEAEGAHAVDQAEIDAFGDAALIRADFQRCHTKNFSGRGTVHIFALGKGFK
jgi:hypothetical protein